MLISMLKLMAVGILDKTNRKKVKVTVQVIKDQTHSEIQTLKKVKVLVTITSQVPTVRNNNLVVQIQKKVRSNVFYVRKLVIMQEIADNDTQWHS